MARTVQVAIDCADPGALARFWAEALGYVMQPPPEGHDSWESWLAAMGVPEADWNAANAVVDPDGRGPRVYFQRVPEGKAVKNRLHLDLRPADGSRDDELERLLGLGATEVDDRRLPDGRGWVVLADPEGNEFCILRSVAEMAAV
jgi:hypothetical protein